MRLPVQVRGRTDSQGLGITDSQPFGSLAPVWTTTDVHGFTDFPLGWLSLPLGLQALEDQ